MCGFLGIFWNTNAKYSKKKFKNLLKTLDHRGPDEKNFKFLEKCWLGHNRLSIVDVNSSQQPMLNTNNTHIIVFNGEIYNYKELAIFLEERDIIFDKNSDTSVLLNGYIALGKDFLRKVNGMFSFAIYNKDSHKIEFVKDRLGKKPLFYAKTEDAVIFSSNTLAILKSGLINTSIDKNAVYLFFKYGFVPEEYCIFQNIKKVKSAEVITYQNRNISADTYWILPNKPNSKEQENQYQSLKKIVFDAIDLRVNQADVEIGSFLSGGIDSSGISSVASLMISDAKLPSFHLVPDERIYNESYYAKKVAEKANLQLHIDYLQPGSTVSQVKRIVNYMDEPFGDSSALPTFQVCKNASQFVKVAISGEGGDEIFLGYDWQRKFVQTFPIRKLAHFVGIKIKRPFKINDAKWKKFRIFLNLVFLSDENAYEFLYAGGTKEILDSLLEDGVKRELNTIEKNLVASKFKKFEGSMFQKLLYVDLKHYLCGDLLTKVDLMSMANSIEIRSPLLDYRIVEYSSFTPDIIKLFNLKKKQLKKIFCKLIPKEIMNRKDKRGFSINKEKRLNNEVLEFLNQFVKDNYNIAGLFFNVKKLKLLINKKSQTSHELDLLWNIFVFVLWLNNKQGLKNGLLR